MNVSREIYLGSNPSDISDPADGAGTELPAFRLYQTYHVGKDKAHRICQKLYERVFQQVNNGSLGSAKPRLIKYIERFFVPISNYDEVYEHTESRKYIVITLDTSQDIRTTIFMRFLNYGDYLYLGVDAYLLGKVRWRVVIKKIFISAITLISFLLIKSLTYNQYILKQNGDLLDFTGVFWWFYIIFIIFFWWELVRRISQNFKIQQKNFSLMFALRQAFQGSLNLNSFNVDDVMAFLKSTLQTGVMAVRDVLNEEGLPVDTLDAFIQNINVNNNFDGSVGTVVGNVQGNMNINPGQK